MSSRPWSQEQFRSAMASWPSGVAVVTTHDDTAAPRGFTASSFCSLSMEPPLVLVCLALTADCRAAFEAAPGFAVHVLRSDQEHLAHRFAAKGDSKFASISTRPGMLGLPLLDGTLARLECRLVDCLPGGDHVILVGEVCAAGVSAGEPLVYHQRNFAGLAATAKQFQAV
jgi:flavin reductase ActVB